MKQRDRSKSVWRIAIFATLAVGFPMRVWTAPDDAEQRNFKRWYALYQKRAEALSVIERHEGDQIPLTLVATPLQSFSNSIRPDQVHGSVHLWTLDGRPRLIGSVWSALDQKVRTQRNLCYEFHSLSKYPLTVSIDQAVIWNPKDGGLEWIPMKEFSAPAKSRALRLTQMRQQMADIRGEIESGESELRMLTQPIYRYPENLKGIVDGAIFSYVIGTDPEIFVMLEARTESTDTAPTWFLAPIRFTGCGISLKQGETTIWQRPAWENYSRENVYDFLYGMEHLSADLPDDQAKPQ